MIMWATSHADDRRAADLDEPRPDETPYTYARETFTQPHDPIRPDQPRSSHHRGRWYGTSGPSYAVWEGAAHGYPDT